MKDDLQRIGDAAVAALGRGDAAGARRGFETIEAQGGSTHQLRLFLAQACAMMGDGPAAHRALDHVLRDEPTNLYALLMRGDLLTDAGDPRAAVSWYQAALTQAPRAGPLSPDLLASLRQAETKIARASQDFHEHLEGKLAGAGVDPAVHPRFAEALNLLTGKAQVQLQQPTNFYYPQLAQRTFFEREEFDWVSGLEAQTSAIRGELEAVLSAETALSPYVVAEANRPARAHPLLDDPRWSAFHFFSRGMPIAANAERCPQTFAALQALPLCRIEGRSPFALFSVLRPRTHIPPHNGMLNTRLICHLPLIVPLGCRLRVGNTVRTVEAGRMMIFDDSIQHEAWNDSDDTRVVLIFEIWRPELTEAEKTALAALFGAIGVYSGEGGN